MSQKWVNAEPNTQSPFQKYDLGTTVQKLHKSRYQSYESFLVLPYLLDFFDIVL